MLQLAPLTEAEAAAVTSSVGDVAASWENVHEDSTSVLKVARRHERILALYKTLRSAEAVARGPTAGTGGGAGAAAGGGAGRNSDPTGFSSFKPGLYVKMRNERLPAIAAVVAS